MGLRGSVKAFSLEQLLDFLSSSGHDGTLHVHHEEHRKTLYLHQNSLFLEPTSSNFRLGDALLRSKVVTAEQLEEALAAQKAREPILLGELLQELGYTTAEKILEARKMQVEEDIYEVFGWDLAFFEFHKDVLPADFDERRADPKEFRFPAHSVLVEATRRRDEWSNIQNSLPSEKRLYVLGSNEGAVKRATRELKEAGAKVTDPAAVFDGMRTVSELPHFLGLSRFESQAVASRLITSGDVRQLRRQELESRFRMAMRNNVAYSLKLYECALESPEFETRGRFLDRVFFGNTNFKGAAEQGQVQLSARIRGKRALEVLLALFRQGIGCEFSAREEGKELRVGFSKSSLAWRVGEGQEPPSVVKHLLARSPVSASDLVRVREMQEQTGRTLQQILVGGGYVTMENWFRAQKDSVLNEVFTIFFMRRPYVEISTGDAAQRANPGLDVDVPLLPWLHAEVMRELREWETLLSQIPSVRVYLELTPKGQKSVEGLDDPLLLFDGQRTIEEVIKEQRAVNPQEFLATVQKKLLSGRLKPLDASDYHERIEAALKAGKRPSAISYCLAAVESNVEADAFRAQLETLRAAESEIATQASRSTFSGDLDDFSLAEVLQTFHLRKSSGTMRVENTQAGTKEARQIYFDGGDVYLLSGDMEEEITEDDLESGLLAAGLVTEDQLADAAAVQMKDELYEMFLWEGAVFEFAADYLPPEFYATRKNRKIRLNTVNFLLEAVRRIAEWERVREALPSDEVVVAFDSAITKMQTVQQRGNEDLLLLADGRHRVSDLIRMSRTRKFKALSLIAELVNEGTLQVIDLEARQEEDADALFASDLPTSGVIEEGFVGQIQFVGTLQDLVGAGLTGIMRVTDGRRSKEIALIEGQVFRTLGFTPAPKKKGGKKKKAQSPEAKRLAELEGTELSMLPPPLREAIEAEMNVLRQAIAMEEEEAEPAEAQAVDDNEDYSHLPEEERAQKEFERQMRRAAREMEEEKRRKEAQEAVAKEAALDSAQDFAECFSWSGTRFELLEGTLPPRLKSTETRGEYLLNADTFFDEVAGAGEAWIKVAETIPKDKVVALTDEARARELAGDDEDLLELIGDNNTAEDVARISGRRFDSMKWLALCFEEGVAVGAEPEAQDGDSEEDWDFSL